MRPLPLGKSPDIVGRHDDRSRVDTFVDRLPTAPRSLIVAGEPGIGKTTVWSYGVHRADAAGFEVLVTRPAEEDLPTPGFGLRDFFDNRVGGSEPPSVELLAGHLDPAERARLFLRLLRVSAAERPVLLAIDDLQWLDTVTRRSIRFALRRLDGYPVAVLATTRTWSPTTPELPLRHASLEADVLHIEPMTVMELHQMLAHRSTYLTRPELERLHEVSGGNPLFAVELSRQWHRGERLAVRATSVKLLAARAEELPSEARRMLNLVAVGGAVPLVALADQGTAHALAVLGGPIAPLVEVDDGFIVRCAHPLIAAAVRASLNPLELQELHAQLLHHATDPVERALHLAKSATETDQDVAQELEAAAATAGQRGSAAVAAELAAHSRRLTPADLVGAAGIRALAELTYRAGAGQITQAIDLADQLLTELQPGPLHSQVVGQRVLLDVLGAEAFLRHAIADVRDDEQRRGVLLDLLGWHLTFFKGRLTEALSCSRQALDIARRTQDTAAIARAAATLSSTSLLTGHRLPELRAEALPAEKPGSTLLRVSPEVFWARQRLWDGDVAGARTGFERTAAAAAAMGSEFQRPYRLCDLATLELATGDLDTAHRLVVEGLEAADEAANEHVTAWLAHSTGLIAALRGDSEEAMWAVERLDAWAAKACDPVRTVGAHHIRGVLAHTLADPPASLQHLLAALAILDELGYRHPGFLPVLPATIDAATTMGRLDTCVELVATLERQAHTLDSPLVNAMLAMGHGQLHLLTGDLDLAGTELRSARSRFDELGYRIDALRARYYSALTQLRTGQRASARHDLERCQAGFAQRGLHGWTALTEDALRRVLGSLGTDLTRTEDTIAAKVRLGLRNKEIAAEMFISESTVEAHLTRIYRKLGVRGRNDLPSAPPGPERAGQPDPAQSRRPG